MTACSYDVAYDPPLPVCEVTLTVALTGRQTTVDAIVDTGADATDKIGNEVVLGRNVLNKLVVTLDGPQQIVRIGT